LSSFYLERIQRGVDFAETRLDEDVALAEIARAAGLSQWHFQRIFKSLTGETLKAYVRSRRLARALERLLTTELRILDIAMMAGFESQEAFARAFKKAFGLTPMEYRRMKNRNLFPRKLKLDEEMMRHINHNVSLEPEIVRQPAMTLVGCRTQFYGPDSEKNNIGEKLPALWMGFLPRLDEVDSAVPDRAYGVVRQEREDGDQLEYFAAVEVSPLGRVPSGMEAVHVPAATYAVFEHRGHAHAIDRTVSYAYSTWLIGSGRRHTYGPDLEIYDSRYHPTEESSVFCYAIPIAD
jgi:AraC family transcriptional regulator